MMVGSVRGKEIFERVVRVLHGGRETWESCGGHARFVPACMDMVKWPQVPQ